MFTDYGVLCIVVCVLVVADGLVGGLLSVIFLWVCCEFLVVL